MGQACLKEKTDPPTGIARRYDNYDDTAARGGDYTGFPISRLDLMRAVSQGTPELTDGARSLLSFYLCCVDTRELKNGRTSAWTGNAAAGEALGKKDSTIRRLKGELEKAGFLIRKYDRRNRPLDKDALDLAPFFAQVPSILREIDERSTKRAARWEGARAADDSTRSAELSGEARKIERLNSTPKTSDCCLGVEEFEKGQDPKPSIPDRVVSEAKQAISDARTIRQALELSPKLKAALDPDGQGVSAQQAADGVWSALPTLFPGDGANSISHTFLWCAKRYGAKAFLFLAIALEDPTAKSPQNLFGFFTTTHKKIDITRNLERIRHKPKPVEAKDETLRLPGDQYEKEIAEAIAAEIGIPKYNAWFRPESTRFREIGDGRVIIEHESDMARDYIYRNFGAQLRVAAETLGYEGYRIEKAR